MSTKLSGNTFGPGDWACVTGLKENLGKTQVSNHEYRRRLDPTPDNYRAMQTAWLSHFNVGVGSRVRFVRAWKPNELGFNWYFVPMLHELIGRELTVSSVLSSGIVIDGYWFPFHVLAPVEEQPKVEVIELTEEESTRLGCTHVVIVPPVPKGRHWPQPLFQRLKGGLSSWIESSLGGRPGDDSIDETHCVEFSQPAPHPPAVPEGQGQPSSVGIADFDPAFPASPTPAIERGYPKYPSDIPDPNLYCRDCDYWGPERRCPKCNDPMVEGPAEEEAIERGEEEDPLENYIPWVRGKGSSFYMEDQPTAAVEIARHLDSCALNAERLNIADRVVACLNACQGVETEDLHRGMIVRAKPTPTPSAGQEVDDHDGTHSSLSVTCVVINELPAFVQRDLPIPTAAANAVRAAAIALQDKQAVIDKQRSESAQALEEITRLRGEVERLTEALAEMKPREGEVTTSSP